MSTAADSYDPKYALWFTADAIRDHFMDSAQASVIDDLTDDELRAVGLDALDTEALYDAFHRSLMWALIDRRLIHEDDE